MSEFFRSENRNEKYDVHEERLVDHVSKRSHLMKSALAGMTAVRSKFENFTAVSSELYAAQWIECEIKNSSFQSVLFSRCTLEAVKFENCVFRDARFEGCVIDGFEFRESPEALEPELVFQNCVIRSSEALKKASGVRFEDCIFLDSKPPATLPKAAHKPASATPEKKPEVAPSAGPGPAPSTSGAEESFRFGQLEIGSN